MRSKETLCTWANQTQKSWSTFELHSQTKMANAKSVSAEVSWSQLCPFNSKPWFQSTLLESLKTELLSVVAKEATKRESSSSQKLSVSNVLCSWSGKQPTERFTSALTSPFCEKSNFFRKLKQTTVEVTASTAEVAKMESASAVVGTSENSAKK